MLHENCKVLLLKHFLQYFLLLVDSSPQMTYSSMKECNSIVCKSFVDNVLYIPFWNSWVTMCPNIRKLAPFSPMDKTVGFENVITSINILVSKGLLFREKIMLLNFHTFILLSILIRYFIYLGKTIGLSRSSSILYLPLSTLRGLIVIKRW